MDLSIQAVFDRAAEHMLQQNKRCENEKGERLYITPDDSDLPTYLLDPVAAAVMPENRRSDNQGWRGFSIRDVLRELHPGAAEARSLVSLLCELQHIHDETPVPRWRERLHKLARRRRLKADVLGTEPYISQWTLES